MLHFARQCVYSPEGIPQAFITLFPRCLYIRHFCYDLSIAIFCSKIFLPLSHAVVDMTSPILRLIVVRIFLRCFGTSCFIYIVWSYLGIFLVFLLSRVFLVGYLYNHFVLIWEFFTPALADSFPLESEWQQVSSNFQDSSLYSGRSQQCYSLCGLHSSSYFQVFPSLYQFFDDYTECINCS